jgi:hypothetical protein
MQGKNKILSLRPPQTHVSVIEAGNLEEQSTVKHLKISIKPEELLFPMSPRNAF